MTIFDYIKTESVADSWQNIFNVNTSTATPLPEDPIEDLKRWMSKLRRAEIPPLSANWWMPRGQIYNVFGALWAHPSTVMMIQNGFRVPLFTRHSLGVIEAERDRRKYRR